MRYAYLIKILQRCDLFYWRVGTTTFFDFRLLVLFASRSPFMINGVIHAQWMWKSENATGKWEFMFHGETKSEPVNCNLNIYASWRVRIKITTTTLVNDVKKNEKKAGLHVWQLLYFRTRARSFYFNEDCENYGHPVFRKWISFFLVLETACINLGNNHAGN